MATLANLRPPTYDNPPFPEPSDRDEALTADGRIYEYTSAANPTMKPVPVLGMSAKEHSEGPTRVTSFNLKEHLNTPYDATSPNLLASFLRVCKGESLETQACATSQAFYIISGKGSSTSAEHGAINWALGDMVVLPKCAGAVQHTAHADYDCGLYWVSDEPLLKFLGCEPSTEIFRPTVIRREQMLKAVEEISHEPGVQHRNRMGILLGNKVTGNKDFPPRFGPSGDEDGTGNCTLTVTPTLWSLLNVLPKDSSQMPHRHQSVALDFCVYAKPKPEGGRSSIYTLMGPELDPTTGHVKDPIRCDWETGAMFVTPPGWWHSHHNETDEHAWVLPMQDAGLFTYQRALDIKFSTGPTVSTEVARKIVAASTSDDEEEKNKSPEPSTAASDDDREA